MPNLRIVTKNALRQSSSLTASSTAGNLAVSSLAAAVKSSLHRFTGTNGSYRATWAAPARIGCVALPFCNWSPTAKQRVRVSKEKSVTNLLTNSERIGITPWGTDSNAGATANNAGVAPDGSFTATLLAKAAATAAYRHQAGGQRAAGKYTASIWVKKAASTPWVFFQLNNDHRIGFNLDTKTVTVAAQLVAPVTGVVLADVGGWVRIGLTATFPAAWGQVFTVGLSNSTGGYSSAALYALGEGHLFWGAMLSEGDPSSYYPSLDTFTSRASNGTYIGSDGLIKTAPANTPRMQHDPMNPFAPPRLLLEAAATNQLYPSRYGFSPTYYATSAATPLIAGQASYVYERIDSGSPQTPPAGSQLGAAGTYCVSAIVEQHPSTQVSTVTRMYFYKTTNGNAMVASVDLDLLTGVSSGSAKRGAIRLAKVGPNGGALYRIWVAYVHDGVETVSVYPYPIAGTTDAVGKKVIVHHMQLEAGEYPTSPIVTTTAAATRAADAYTSAPGVRPDGYIDHWQSYDYDSGWVLACPAPAVELEGFTAAQAASAYAYGGGAYARQWLPQQLDAAGLAVDIADPDNLQGYIEAACMVAGPVWSPRYNASGTSVSVIDRTEVSRSAAGDQLADPGTLSRKVPVDLRAMPEEDRARFLDLVRNSRAHPILMSVFPEHPDLALERDFMVYGRRTKDSDIAYQFAGAYSTTLEIEEI